MEKTTIYPAQKSNQLTPSLYQKLYQQSIEHSELFWAEQAKQHLDWIEAWKTVCSGNWHEGNIRWFDGAKLNASYNCLDRHLEKHADKIAILWEGDDPNNSCSLTYRQLHKQVCQFAQVLKSYGAKKGDRVCIYMPMIPEAVLVMLACARIGAIHSVVFAGFSARALEERIQDANCSLLITADESVRAGKTTPLKNNADIALKNCPSINTVIVIKRTGKTISMQKDRDHWFHEVMAKFENNFNIAPEAMDAEDPLFILYTSGSTGKPKGVLHTTAGYLLYAATTFQYVFDYQEKDIYWCTADIGWITGHSYMVYGPLAKAATIVMFEGTPQYPNAARFWEIIDKYKVTLFYTSPTAIRALMREGDDWLKKTNRSSLRLLGSVGEPINPEAWEWYYHTVGNSHSAIVDTWWQTETGGIMISALPGAHNLKPGSASQPFFGIKPALLDQKNQLLDGAIEGKLVITQSWPGQARTLYNNHERFMQAYFTECPGYYYTGDGARRDEDGDYWITGRIDDVVNISGHRIGTAEVESALVLHPSVAEAAVVDIHDEIKGSAIIAYVILRANAQASIELNMALLEQVKNEIGAIARPKAIYFCRDLPKTRSGKIMRRILRCIARKELDKIGDTSTLANPEIVEELIREAD